jgi:hypothetical protein
MKPSQLYFVAAATVLATATSTPAAVAHWAPSPLAVASVTQGRVFIEVLAEADHNTGIIHAAIDIPAPPTRVWAVMTDCARTPVLMANTSCRIVSGDMRAGSDVREQVTGRNFIFPPMHNVVRVDYTPFSLMRFRRAGGDFQTLEGEWRLEPISNGAGTRVIYINRLAVNLPIPSPLMREGMRRDVPRMLMNLRRESLAGR